MPPLKGGTALAGQNPVCREVYDLAGVMIGRWTEAYGAFENAVEGAS